MSQDPFPRTRRQRRAAFVAGLVHDLHRVRIPVWGRALLPLQVAVLEDQLLDLHDVLGRHGIPFWLRDGTALGAYRDGGIIPYDDDVDVGIWASSAPRLDAALRELEALRFVVYRRTPWIVGLIRHFETTEIVISGGGAPDSEYERVREGFFRAPEPLAFLGRQFLVPAPIEAYLEFSYGADWRVPRVDAWSNSCWQPPERREAIARQHGRPPG